MLLKPAMPSAGLSQTGWWRNVLVINPPSYVVGTVWMANISLSTLDYNMWLHNSHMLGNKLRAKLFLFCRPSHWGPMYVDPLLVCTGTVRMARIPCIMTRKEMSNAGMYVWYIHRCHGNIISGTRVHSQLKYKFHLIVFRLVWFIFAIYYYYVVGIVGPYRPSVVVM